MWRALILAAVLLPSLPAPGWITDQGNGSSDSLAQKDADGVSHAKVVVPMVFPVLGRTSWSDAFLAPRDGGARRHHGQDIFAPKMRQLVAVFDGRVYFHTSSGPGGNNILSIYGDNGWTATYMHINNDTPGTDDGMGTKLYAFSPGIRCGARVKAGQFVAYVGDSGNAEGTSPHCHFELCSQVTGAVVNPAPSLRAAKREGEPVPADKQPELIPPPDLSVFDGSLDVKSDEVRLEGRAVSIDEDIGEIVMEVSTVVEPDGRRTDLTPTRRKIVRTYSNTVIRDGNNAGIALRLRHVQVAPSFTVIGRSYGPGSMLPARVIAVPLPPSERETPSSGQ